MDNEPKKLPIEDERYRIPGTNAFNFSQWSRENIPKDLPKYKVGDVVVVTLTCEVTQVGTDCDGTPLYGLDRLNGFGWSEDDMRPATDEEKANF